MSALTREELLGTKLELKRERVPAPEYGEGREVIVQEMTVAARERYSEGLLYEDPDDPGEDGEPKMKHKVGEMYARLVAFSVVGEDGALQYHEEDIPAISAMPSRLVERIARAAHRVSGIGEEAAESARKN